MQFCLHVIRRMLRQCGVKASPPRRGGPRPTLALVLPAMALVVGCTESSGLLRSDDSGDVVVRVVSDRTGASIIGARVAIWPSQSGTPPWTNGQSTDRAGEVRFGDLEHGTYHVRAAMIGYRIAETMVVVPTHKAEPMEVRLEIAVMTIHEHPF